MRRRTRQLLLAGAGAALLAGAVGFQLRHERAAFPGPLTQIDAASVTQLTVRCRGCDTRRFEKVRDTWWMREPYALAADAQTVAGLLAVATVPVRIWYAKGDLDPARLGLDPPLIELELGAQTIRIGTTDAIDSDRYLGVGDAVARAPDRFSPRLLAVAESEIERHLVPVGETLLAVHLTTGTTTTAGDTTAWQRASALRIEKPPADFEPSAAGSDAVLEMARGGPIRYRLMRSADRYLAVRDAPALIYVLDQATIAALVPDGSRAAQ